MSARYAPVGDTSDTRSTEPARPPYDESDAVPRSVRVAVDAGIRYAAREPVRAERRELERRGLFLGLDDPDRTRRYIARRRARGGAQDSEARTAESLVALEAVAAEPARSFVAALERYIGRVDLVPVVYLQTGERAAKAVGRIRTPTEYGTGFFVGEALLLTNHHVLPDQVTARGSIVQLHYELDLDGRLCKPETFALDPDTCFIADEALDYALVAVKIAPEQASAYGCLPLIADDAKIIVKDFVSVIQHPGAEPKQAAIRGNELTDVLADFLHYTSDTAPGASGSPVFNDEWEVVALHHSGVPRVDANGHLLTTTGAIWNAAMGPAAIDWIANEGVRISRILAHLNDRSDIEADRKHEVLDLLKRAHAKEAAMREVPVVPRPSVRDALKDGTIAAGVADTPSRRPTETASMATLNIPTDHAYEIAVRITPIVGAEGPVPAIEEGLGDWAKKARDLADSAARKTKEFAEAGAKAARDAANAAAKAAKDAADAEDAARKAASAVADAAIDAYKDVTQYVDRAAVALLPGSKRPSPVVNVTLHEGDVFLYSGKSIVSKAIMFFTESDVSHAGLYLGGDMVGEALGQGLVQRSRGQSVAGANWVLARRLGKAAEMKPVINRARFYLGKGLKYGYQDIVLLAILLIMKRVRPANVLGQLIQRVAATAANTLNQFLEGGQDLMICSEFVYRSYDEASTATPDPYTLEVPGIAFRESLPAGDLPAGVEPGSPLAQLYSRPELVKVAFSLGAEAVTAQPTFVERAVTEQEVDVLLLEYFEEVKARGAATGDIRNEAFEAPFTLDMPTAAAIAQFAVALEAARQHSLGKSPGEALAEATHAVFPSQLPAALQRLFQTPADFVTPADLRRSTSLADLGCIT